MDIVKELQQLEDKFYGEWEEDKNALLTALTKLHLEAAEDHDSFSRFLVQSADMFGGIYIPYLFWDKLAYFLDAEEQRTYLQDLMMKFADSNFEEDEQSKMKLLLVVYFAKEKEFEINKIRAMIIEKSHPAVKEYYLKLLNFTEKNQKATDMYCEKFVLLKDIHPDFDLLGLPITQLKEKLQEA
ncbi:MAG: hypothetical protein NWR72_08400 [Bacteroidia bacterium]|nr:hypothetical protein [Bacteroidia bacterium]